MHKKQNLWTTVAVFVLILGLVPLSLVFAQGDDMAAQEEENKELITRFLQDGFRTGDIDVLMETVSPNFIENEEGSPLGGDFSIEMMSEMTTMLANSITDFEIEIVEIIAEDDKVAVLMTWTGTHEGEFMGMPATGNEFEIPVFDLFRIEDGLVAEHWGVTDNLAFGMAFGMIPPMEEGM